MPIPPGIRYLSHAFLLCIPISIFGYLVLSILIKYLDLGATTPQWRVILLALLTRPFYSFVLLFWNSYAISSDARRNGAQLVPQVRDPWPGGMSLVSAMVKSFKSGYPGDIFLEWCEQYGNTYSLNVVSEPRIFTFEPEHIKAILATQFENFEKGPVLYSQFSSLLGTGVFNSDGDMWKFHRTMTRPFFSKERISHFDVFDRHADDAINQAKDRLAAGHPIDFQDLVSRFTLDSATEFLFGTDVHSLSAGIPYPYYTPFAASANRAQLEHPSNQFVSAFIAGQTLSSLRTRYGPSWALVEFWKDRIQPHRDIVNGFIEPILEEAIVNCRKNYAGGEPKEKAIMDEDTRHQTLLDHLVCETQDREILKDELTNLLVAARDTTASTLTFAMYMLTQHPHVVKRLREEIARTVGGGRPTYEQIKEMKYLRAFINETLRLYPPVPFDSRTSNKATVWPSKTPGVKPLYIPAHTKCTYGIFLMHRRTDLWGSDALEFDPDRFLDARVHKYLTPNPFIFLPFNAGPRICLGQQFAYHETSFFLVRLLQSFSHFALASEAQPPDSRPPTEWRAFGGSKGRDKVWPGVHLTMYVKGGLWVNMSTLESDLPAEDSLKTVL